MTTVRYAHDLDIQYNKLLQATFQEVNGLPVASGANTGWVVRNLLDGRLYMSTGSAWELRSTNSDALQGNGPAYYLNRANHTGAQSAATITDFAPTVALTPLSSLAAPTGPLNLNNQKITNLAAATGNTDVPTWGQVSDLVTNLGFKQARVASTANVPISSTGNGASIDGVTIATGDVILLKDQTSGAENGIYRVGAANLARDAGADSAAEMPSGTIVVVDQGTANGDKMFMLTTPAGYVLGTTALTFSPYGTAPNPYTAGNGIAISSNQISVVAGSGIIVDGTGVRVDPAVMGGHVEVTLSAPGSGTSVTVTHNLNRRPVPVAVMEVSSGDLVYTGVNFPDANNVTFDFPVAPTNGQYRVSVG